MRIVTVLFLLLSQPVLGQSAPPVVKFLQDAELRDLIKSAPEEQPGQPGLYSLRLSPESEHPIIGIRRTVPGKSEVHADFTDVWYVIEGSATLVTGGTMVDPANTAPGEIRGDGIEDGKSRRVQKGDFAVVPADTPHWISAVDGDEILYIVVKVPAKNAAGRL